MGLKFKVYFKYYINFFLIAEIIKAMLKWFKKTENKTQGSIFYNYFWRISVIAGIFFSVIFSKNFIKNELIINEETHALCEKRSLEIRKEKNRIAAPLFFSTKFPKVRHFFHIVDPSPWPFLVSIYLSSVALYLIASLHYIIDWNSFFVQIGLLLFAIFLWFRDITREGVFEGQHTKDVQKNIKLGMALFIVSEIMFFFSFFWAFFHVSLSPSIEIGGIWPPVALKLFNPLTIPLLNTAILLLSGCTLTWVHFSLIRKASFIKTMYLNVNSNGKVKNGLIGMLVEYTNRDIRIFLGFFFTLFLSFFFTFLQFLEYKNAPFSISDSVYGSAFFLMTGFHGFHVIVGTIFIIVCFFFFLKKYITVQTHVSFECAAWYWHFVDVVWLFLYASIYWWGSWI